MTNETAGRGQADLAAASPRLAALSIVEGIELRKPLFLPTLHPCCAQLALPYMAKVIGSIGNRSEDEVMARITVVLLNEMGNPISETSDVIALDRGEWGEFEVKIREMTEDVKSYRIKIERTDESDPWFA